MESIILYWTVVIPWSVFFLVLFFIAFSAYISNARWTLSYIQYFLCSLIMKCSAKSWQVLTVSGLLSAYISTIASMIAMLKGLCWYKVPVTLLIGGGLGTQWKMCISLLFAWHIYIVLSHSNINFGTTENLYFSKVSHINIILRSGHNQEKSKQGPMCG